MPEDRAAGRLIVVLRVLERLFPTGAQAYTLDDQRRDNAARKAGRILHCEQCDVAWVSTAGAACWSCRREAVD